MREIKFRVWDKINKVWATDFTIDLDGDLLCDNGSTLFIRNHFELMQSLGVKDKNGQNVYWDDIIKYHPPENTQQNPRIFHLIQEEEPTTSCGCCDTVFGYSVHDSLDNPEHIEVIGNIHENPELLND